MSRTTLTEVWSDFDQGSSIFERVFNLTEADETNYYVLATDYFQYAIGWGCEDLEDDRSREFAWVLSRTPELPEAYNERTSVYIDEYLDRSFIRNTTQADEDCFGTSNFEANKIRTQFYGKN